jgi:glycosyltransferase 2 family protein
MGGRRPVSKCLRTLGSLTLLGLLAWRMDWDRVGASFAHLNWALWLAALGLFVGAQVASSVRWWLLARVLGFDGSLGRYVAYYFIGTFFNLFLPTSVGGDVVRAWYLARHEAHAPGQRKIEAFLSVFADRVNGVLVLVALACVGTFVCPVPLPIWMNLAAWGIGAAALAGLASYPLLSRFADRSERLRRLVEGGWTYLRHGRALAWATLLSVVVQVANVLVVWWVGLAMGLSVPGLYYAVMVPLVSLLTLLPISLNGMGLREAGTVLFLAPLGVGTAEGVTLSFLSFAAYCVTSLCGVGFYLFGRFPRFVAETPAGLEERRHDDAVSGGPNQGRARQPQTAA